MNNLIERPPQEPSSAENQVIELLNCINNFINSCEPDEYRTGIAINLDITKLYRLLLHIENEATLGMCSRLSRQSGESRSIAISGKRKEFIC